MADLSYLNKNNEQRVQLSSVGTLQVTMPGGQPLVEGEQHVICAIPKGALLKGWTAFVDEATGWEVEVSIGTVDNPTLFTSALGVSSVNVNDKTLPFEYFFEEITDVVCTLVTTTGGDDNSVSQFVLDYTEVETTCGAYTA